MRLGAMIGRRRDAPSQEPLGPWSEPLFCKAQEEIRALSEQRASPLRIAEKLRELKETLQQAKSYERFDPKNLTHIQSKTNYTESFAKKCHFGAISCLQVLPDGTIVSGSEALSLSLLKRNGDGEYVDEKIGEHKDEVTCLRALPDGSIVSGSKDRALCYWRRESDGTWDSERIYAHTAAVLAVQPLLDGRILSVAEDGELLLLGRKDERRWSCETIAGDVACFDALPDGRIVAASHGNILKILSKGEDGTWRSEEIGKYPRAVDSLQALSANRILSGGYEDTIRLWERNTHGAWEQEEIGAGRAPVFLSALQAVPDGRIVSAHFHPSALLLWSRVSRGMWAYEQIEIGQMRIGSLQAVPDGRIVAGSQDGLIYIYDGEPVVEPHSFLSSVWRRLWR